MVLGKAFVVAHASSVSVFQASVRSNDPTARQDLEAGGVVAAFDDLHHDLVGGFGPGEEFAGVVAVGPGQLDATARAAIMASSGRAPSRSCTDAAVTSTHNSRPRVSTTMWRLRPLI